MAEGSETIAAVEIHDLDERGVLAFDLADLLAVLPVAAEADWIVTDYHPVFEDYSDETAVFAGSVQEARESGELGVRITGTERQHPELRFTHVYVEISEEFAGYGLYAEGGCVQADDLGVEQVLEDMAERWW